jgi:hypothetical protein
VSSQERDSDEQPEHYRKGSRDRPSPWAGGRAAGVRAARGLWLLLWGNVFLALQPAARAPRGLSDMISRMASGQSGWLARTGSHPASALSHHGLAASVGLAAALIVVAAGICQPPPCARAALVLAVIAVAAIWPGEGLGGVLTCAGTDPGSGPLLALPALAYWPARMPARGSPHPVPAPTAGA